MITGDNIWTGIEAATRAGIVKQNKTIVAFEGSKQITNSAYRGVALSRVEGKVSQSDLTLSEEEFLKFGGQIAIDSSFLDFHHSSLPKSIRVFARAKPETKLHIIKTTQEKYL